MPYSPQTRPSLMARLRDPRDHEAWAEFVAIYEPLLLRLMQRHALQDCDGRDVCQQVLENVARDIEQWKPDGREASFRRWLFRIARNRALKFLMQERRAALARGGTGAGELLAAQPDLRESLSAEFEREFRRQLLWQAARQVRGEFRETTWEAFRRTCLEGQSPAEAARELGTSVGNVYVARSRIIARLRAKVQEIEDSET